MARRTSLALAPFEINKPVDPNTSLHVEVTANKNKFEVLVSLGELKWYSNVSYKQITNFHHAIQRNFTSLIIPELPDKNKCIKTPIILRAYLISILRNECIRMAVDILKLIGFHCKIAYDVPEYMRTYQENWRAPLAEQPLEVREAIGNIVIFCYQGWNSFELGRYYEDPDILYIAQNRIQRVNRQTKKYLYSIVQSIFERLNLPIPSSNRLESGPTRIDDSIITLSTLDTKYKWAIVWEILLQALLNKSLDSRVHVSVQQISLLLNLSLEELSIAEKECSAILRRQLIEMRREEMKNASRNRALKIGAGAAVGGGVMFVAGLLALPLLVPAMISGFGTAAGVAAAAPIAGASLAAGVAAAGALATSVAPFLPLLFGAMGAGLVGCKVSNITEGIEEFSFVRIHGDDSEPKEENKIPEERYEINYQTKTIVDKKTGQKYEAKNENVDFKKLASLLNKAASKSGYKSEENGLKLESNETAKQRKKRIEKGVTEKKKEEESTKDSDDNHLTPEEEEIVDTSGMEVFIAVNGWLWNEEEVTTNFNTIPILHPGAEVYSLRWQTEHLNRLGKFIVAVVTDEALGQILEAIIVALSATAAAFLAALAIPMYLLTASILIDNPWTLVSNHAKRAGKLLAKALISRAAGRRPVSLLGWSHGARVIFSALEYLNKIDNEDYRGIVQNVYFIGAPITSKLKRWEAVRPLVAGRMVNCYSTADWLLPIIHRAATGKSKPVAGVMKIDVPTVENIDITNTVGGHMSYSRNLKKIFKLLDLTNSVPTCYVHRSTDETLLSRIPDACLKQLSLEAKRKQATEEKERKLEKKQNSFTSKIQKFTVGSSSNPQISSPTISTQREAPAYLSFRSQPASAPQSPVTPQKVTSPAPNRSWRNASTPTTNKPTTNTPPTTKKYTAFNKFSGSTKSSSGVEAGKISKFSSNPFIMNDRKKK